MAKLTENQLAACAELRRQGYFVGAVEAGQCWSMGLEFQPVVLLPTDALRLVNLANEEAGARSSPLVEQIGYADVPHVCHNCGSKADHKLNGTDKWICSSCWMDFERIKSDKLEDMVCSFCGFVHLDSSECNHERSV
jgi:hypothetical protein